MAIATPRSPVIPIFLVIAVLGILLTAAGGTYLYFQWEKHFPPIADLQEQVRTGRATSEAAKAAEKDLERTGVPEWTEQLNDQYSNRANEMAKRMERDLAKAQAAAESAETSEHNNAPPAAHNETDLAAVQRSLAEQRSSAATGAAIRRAIAVETTATEKKAPPKKSTGTIEKMADDWLPPGVTRSE